jgi:hypothetical protein
MLGWTVVETRTQRLVFVLSRAGHASALVVLAPDLAFAAALTITYEGSGPSGIGPKWDWAQVGSGLSGIEPQWDRA